MTAPQNPVITSAYVSGPNSITVNWNKITNWGTSGFGASRVDVYRSNGTQLTSAGNNTDPNLTSIKVTATAQYPFVIGTSYTLKLWAFGRTSVGAPSSIPFTFTAAAPSKPSGIQISVTSMNSITVSWARITTWGYYGFGSTRVDVYRPNGTLLTSKGNNTDPNLTSIEVIPDPKYPFVNGAAYSVQVLAYSYAARALTSTTVPFTFSYSPPAPPTNVRAVPYAPGQVQVSWNAPTSYGTGGFSLIRVFAYCFTGGCSVRTADALSATQTSVVISGLTPNIAYTYMVSAANKINAATNSAYTPSAVFLDPLAITNVSRIITNATTELCTSASMTWNALPNKNTGLNYVITATASGYPTVTSYSATSYGVLIPLNPGVTYSIVVSATNTSSATFTSKPYSFAVPNPKIPLPAVSSITFTKYITSGVGLIQWIPITNVPSGLPALSGYDVWYTNTTTGVTSAKYNMGTNMAYYTISLSVTVGNNYQAFVRPKYMVGGTVVAPVYIYGPTTSSTLYKALLAPRKLLPFRK